MEKIPLGPMPYMSVMPTVLVGADVDGKPTYMTAAWATVACMVPPMVCVAINRERYTAKGIDQNGTFSLNVPSVDQVIPADYCGIVSGDREDKSGVFRSFYWETRDRTPGRRVPGQHRVQAVLFRGLREPRPQGRGGRGDLRRPVLYDRRETGYHEDQPDRLRPVHLFRCGQPGRESVLGRKEVPEGVRTGISRSMVPVHPGGSGGSTANSPVVLVATDLEDS